MSLNEALDQLNHVISISRIHFYKPIQIAEVLFKNRTSDQAQDLLNLESYRTISRRWRDEKSLRIVGRICSSSAKYQDDVWNDTAMPPKLLNKLAEYNRTHNGIIESYIYTKIKEKHGHLGRIYSYIHKAEPTTFDLAELISMFSSDAGLIRSMDKVYEITVYALFLTLTKALDVSVELKIGNKNVDLINEFEDFTVKVYGLSKSEIYRTLPAFVYRVGATNAADRGLDMWSTFGAAIQVKHLTLKEELLDSISADVTADRLIIVCKQAESRIIDKIFEKTGARSKVQAIVTFEELEEWYIRCLKGTFSSLLAKDLLSRFKSEFEYEFPFVGDYLGEMWAERKYKDITIDKLV